MKKQVKRVVAVLMMFSMLLCGTIGISSSVAEAEREFRNIEVKEETISQESIAIDVKVTDEWTNHYNAEVTIKNVMDEKWDDWMVAFDFTDEIEHIWNAKIVSCNDEGHHYVIKNVDWNQDIQPGESVVFGMTVKCGNGISRLTDYYDATDLQESEKEYEVEYTQFSKWDNKVNGQITIRNKSDREIRDWRLEFLGNIAFIQVWNAEVLENDNGDCYVKNMSYNQNIPAGGEVSFGFIASCDGEKAQLSDYSLYEIVLWEEMEENKQSEEDKVEESNEGDEIIWEESDFTNKKSYEEYLKSRADYAVYTYRKTRAVSVFEEDEEDFVSCEINYDILSDGIPNEYTIKYKGVMRDVNNNVVHDENNNVIVQDKEVTLKNIRGRAVQNFCIVGNDLYATQHHGRNTFLMHFKLDNKEYTAKFVDGMVLIGFGHGQSIQTFTYGGKRYFLLDCNAPENAPKGTKDWGTEIACIQYNKDSGIEYGCRTVAGQEYGLIKDLEYATDDGKTKGAIKQVEFGLYGKKTLVLWKRKGKRSIQLATFDISKLIGGLTSKNEQGDISFKTKKCKCINYKFAKYGTARYKKLYPNYSMQALDIVGNSKIYMSSGLEDTMSISKFVQTKKRLSRKLRYIQNTADPLPKNTYEVEGMQAEGNSLYYCLAPTDATGGSKFPQYIVSVDR